ncbi:DUF6448 family protein [Streptosporangium sp. NPDC000396]|uniref:DUF6448 family protein n=1 Tax=Streptosporangium sp. NPDC000396 TaxID=3366185 RepID=UPI0036BC4540
MSGPVVTAAKNALRARDVDLVLPYVHTEGEDEVRRAFSRVLPLRALGPEVADLADQWFFETVVRMHRAGENAPYTGLKPAGVDEGSVLPLAEKAVETGSIDEVHSFLTAELRTGLQRRINEVGRLAEQRDGTVGRARAHVAAMLGFEVYCHHVHQLVSSDPHNERHEDE